MNVVPKGSSVWKGSIESSQYNYFFNLLYTVYSLPNIVLPFFGGYLTDKLSARLMNVVFCICLLTGQVTLTIGAFIGSFPLMILGRVFFGFGGESLCVSVQTLIQQWFNESLNRVAQDSIVRRFGLGLAFAMGLNLSLSRLGSVFNNLISPAVALHFAHSDDDEALPAAGSSSGSDSAASAGPGVPYALAFGCLVMGAATVASVVVYIMDAAAERSGRQAGYGDGAASVRASSEKTERLLPETSEDGDASEEINLSAVFSFNSAFWLLSVSCISVYACVLPWNNIAQAFLLEKYLCPPHGMKSCGVGDNDTETEATNTVKVGSFPLFYAGSLVVFLRRGSPSSMRPAMLCCCPAVCHVDPLRHIGVRITFSRRHCRQVWSSGDADDSLCCRSHPRSSDVCFWRSGAQPALHVLAFDRPGRRLFCLCLSAVAVSSDGRQGPRGGNSLRRRHCDSEWWPRSLPHDRRRPEDPLPELRALGRSFLQLASRRGCAVWCRPVRC